MLLEFKWTISKARYTYGYNVCSLYVDGRKVSSCNGGGYDMESTVLGAYIDSAYAGRLLKLNKEFYGLTYHDPDYDPGKAVIRKGTQDQTLGGANGLTVGEAEKQGKSFGLERYQAFYWASSKVPTNSHRVPLINGSYGSQAVEKIMLAIGLQLERVKLRSQTTHVYLMIDKEKL